MSEKSGIEEAIDLLLSGHDIPWREGRKLATTIQAHFAAKEAKIAELEHRDVVRCTSLNAKNQHIIELRQQLEALKATVRGSLTTFMSRNRETGRLFRGMSWAQGDPDKYQLIEVYAVPVSVVEDEKQ
jgi:hypothetical protein